MIISPQPFAIREECQKVTWQNGYRLALGETDGWASYGSTTARGTIALASGSIAGPWYLALDHAGVIAELEIHPIAISGPGKVRYAFAALSDLYTVLSRVYELAVSLPVAPLDEFRAAVEGMPRETEAERLVVQRKGQDIFRARLMAYWQGRCPLTGITDPALLRASHIKPWADCETDAERLDIHNGLLLSALWDAAFDKGLVTFEDDGSPRASASLSDRARSLLIATTPIKLTDQHCERLAWHRCHVFV